MSKKVLIIGGVAGGASCAARLRRLDEQAEILLLERGPYISYANCGLPYHVGGVIPDRDDLLLADPAMMRGKFNFEVRVNSEVVAIDRERHCVTIRPQGGEPYEETYDRLVLATGSTPQVPPVLGSDDPAIMTAWTVPDAEQIRAFIREHQVQRVTVLGGGFIGLEMAENLRRLGVAVTLLEAQEQVLGILDPEMALLVEGELRCQQIALRLGVRVSAFVRTGDCLRLELEDGSSLPTELVIAAAGVRPNSQLAAAAGLPLNERGGVVVDQYLRTADPDIYAVGDVIEVEDYVLKGRTMIPLAGPANKQGRLAAGNICGLERPYRGLQGTSVLQVGALTVASTGLNEKTLVKQGVEYHSVVIVQNSHAAYYPGAEPMTMKLLFSRDGRQLYGAQVVGSSGVDKRIDVIAATLRLGGGVAALAELELAYAPPYGAAKDPVNMLGFVAQNVVDGLAVFADWRAAEQADEQTLLLDVRNPDEVAEFAIPGALNIPLGQLRQRLSELPRERRIVVFCAAGVRAYNAARILMQQGFAQVSIYPGGAGFYQATHPQQA